MPRRTHEHTVNVALGEVLQTLGQRWRLHVEEVGGVFEEGGRPDILIEKADGWPIVLEAEVGNHRQAETEARSRLGLRLIGSSHTVHACIAIVYPPTIGGLHGEKLREALSSCSLDYIMVSTGVDDQVHRFPADGWLSGGITELAILLHRSSIPAWRIESLADALELGIRRAEGDFSHMHPTGSALGQVVADKLGQSDDGDGQTRRMAMAVIADALVFQVALAEAEMEISDVITGEKRAVLSPQQFRENGSFRPTALLDEWERILTVNYWPIFHTAGAILSSLPTQTAAATLNVLWSTAEELVVGGVTKSHDLTGIVFQRLIADRKFLATYYTSPSGAALIAGLAMPSTKPIKGDSWGHAESISKARIGDFACGTGTLLSTAYQRMGLLHEVHGGNPRALHPAMMENGLVGLDVLNIAVHLTAAMLAGSHPDTPFEGECLLTMPYGPHEWGVSLGSLDLLEPQASLEIMQAAANTAGGRGAEEVRTLIDRVGHGQFDLVIMNPPFTRHGAREGDRTSVHNPAFAAFGATEIEQNQMSAQLRKLAGGGCAHGHAGLASYFVELAHRKAAPSGTVALVLPLSAMSGKSWEGARELWMKQYSSIVVATIAERSSHTRSFSADTGIAECLLVARKMAPASKDPRAFFAILRDQPRTTIEGELIGQAVSDAVTAGSIRKLEDGPIGGTRILLGSTCVGEVLDCPIPSDGPWQTVGISDVTLAQTAYKLAHGCLWIEGMQAASVPQIPVKPIGDICSRIGPHHLDLTGAQIKGDKLPQGPFEKLDGVPAGAAYLTLWGHDNQRERRLIVEPDSHCRIREVGGIIPDRLRERAETRWLTASRAHYSCDVQFNSQSLIVATTTRRTLGGRAWPSVIFEDPAHEFAFALWCNSTLGLLCHWWMSNKSQNGRGTTTVSGIPKIPTIDLSSLSPTQHKAAEAAFQALAGERFLPFDQINEDPARAELDRRLITNVLGLAPALCHDEGPIALLRDKIANEPQVHGNKLTRVVFVGQGEESVLRGTKQD